MKRALSLSFAMIFSLGAMAAEPIANNEAPPAAPVAANESPTVASAPTEVPRDLASEPNRKIDLNTVKPTSPFNLKNKTAPEFQIGDWNSSGDMPRPYLPPYQYAYVCQAQLTDNVSYTDNDENGEPRRYDRYMIAEFRLENGQTSVNSDELAWFGKKFYGLDEIQDTEDPAPFDTKGHSISLSFQRGKTVTDDEVFLNLYINQKVGPLMISAYGRQSFSRNRQRFYTTTQTHIRYAGNLDYPELFLRVVCDKEK